MSLLWRPHPLLRVLLSLLPALLPASQAFADPHADFLEPPQPSLVEALQPLLLAAPEPPKAASPSSHSTIRLLVVHEPALGDDIAQLDELIDTTNTIYQQSGIALTFEVAAFVPLSVAAGTNSAALHEITDSREVARARETFGADMVALLRSYDRSTHGGCGMAWITTTDPFRNSRFVYDYAFSVTSVGRDGNSFCSDSTLAHELGHNFGAAHDRGNAGVMPRRPYAYGWGFPGQFGTVMSYINPGVDYFSTPELAACNGNVCGDSQEADVVRAINEVRDAFAALTPDINVPAAPTISGASPLVDEVTLTFIAGDDGGAAIEQYTASCSGVTQTGERSPITVQGLDPATSYACTVRATNAIGNGPESEEYLVDTLPIPAPTITDIDVSDGELIVRVDAGGVLGSYDILGYTVTCGDRSAQSVGPRVPISGLSNGVSYLCTATVTTSLGSSAASPASSAVPEERLSPGLNLLLIKAIQERR